MSNFEIVDRRGSNKVEEVKTVVAEDKPELAQDRSGWKTGSLTYLLQITPIDGQPLIAGTAAAIRSDGNPFVANFLLEQLWSEGFRWESKAKKRLDTFLGCECANHSPCVRHRHLIQQWIQEDRERLAQASVKPVPEVVEVMIKAAQARQAAQPNIVVPRG